MKIDLIKLTYSQVAEIEIKGSYLISKEYWGLTDIIDLKEVKAEGTITKNAAEELCLNLEVSGTMILQDSRTLDDIPYEYKLNIVKIIDENNEIKQNMLDIEPILWENIVLEVPISITKDTSSTNLKGEGWELK